MNHFEFYGLPVSFSLDVAAVKRTYLQNSKKYHPDFHTLADVEHQDKVLEMATLNNEAYKTLVDPDKRMQYVLELKGMFDRNGGNEQLPQDFLMEMMDINEQLMELEFDFDQATFDKTLQSVKDIEAELTGDVQPIIEKWSEKTGNEADLKKVKDFFLKKRYLLRITENLSKFAPAKEIE